MASKDDKTEKPTPKRRQEAREKGQNPRSADLGGAGVLAAGILVVAFTGPEIAQRTGATMTELFDKISRPSNVVSGAGLRGIEHLVETTLLGTVVPVAGICVVAGVALNVVQGGVRFAPGKLRPDLGRLNPMTGAKNLFGPRIAFETFKALAKVSVVAGMVALALVPSITHPAAAVGTSPGALSSMLDSGIKGIAIRAVAGYLLLGLIDYVWQRRRFEQSLKMTKQEVKDDLKQQALPPEVRGAIRRRQMQQARARMMAAVPKADVVIANPTHFAVALVYDGSAPAPVCVAKGQDLVALQIRRLAEESSVPVVENKPLARELHRLVEIDQMIPAELYAAVAEVLAYVYRMAARRRVSA